MNTLFTTLNITAATTGSILDYKEVRCMLLVLVGIAVFVISIYLIVYLRECRVTTPRFPNAASQEIYEIAEQLADAWEETLTEVRELREMASLSDDLKSVGAVEAYDRVLQIGKDKIKVTLNK